MKTILITIILISLIAKIVIHNRLNKIHHRPDRISSPGMQPISFFFPYMQQVKPRYKKEKRLCNFFYTLLIGSVITIFIYALVTDTNLKA